VATGTGEVALRAAAAGADVTALDISPGLLEQARAKRGADAIRWDLGDAQRLPYEDRRFDVVSSVFGVIFAPDHAAAARELARVSRPGGRLGLVTWRPDAGPHALLARFTEERPASDPEPWGSEERVSELLGETFELEFGEGVWHLEGATPEAVWDFFSASVPPLKAFAERLDPERHGEFRQALIEHWEGFRTPAGVREPRPYLVVLGTRR
jgi:SAM-dependent methyltransferase